MKRTLSLLMFGALLGLSACSSSPAVAASVNGHDISNSTVTGDVSGFAQSAAFRSSLAQQGVHLTKNGPAPTSFAAQWLVSLMQNQAIALVAKQHHVSATAQEKSAALAQFKSSQSSGTAFGQLPKGLQTKIVDAAALQAALRASLKPISNAPALQQAFQALQADCTSKKLIGHILVDSPEKAQQVIDQLKKGSSFADVSKQISTDTGASAQGGLLMCQGSSQWNQLDATFRAGAEATPVGGLSAPIKTQFGYHVIEALDLTPENAAPLVTATAQPADPLAPLLTKYMKTAKLYVNPRFGKLRRQGGAFTIDPPTPKTTKSRPAPTPTSTSKPSGSTPAPSATSPTTTSGQGAGTSSTTTP
jgi:Parvulin-like peptidyl-prolyl isomerase